MNINELHPTDKMVSAIPVFKSEQGNATAIQILKARQLKEHISKVPAFLICISGEAVFENEKGQSEKLDPGAFVQIEAMVKHWISAVEDSQFLLVK